MEIPGAYRALRDAERLEAASRTEAQGLYRRLGRARYWYLLRIFVVFNFWTFLFVGFPLLLVVGVAAAQRLSRELTPLLRAQLSDTLGDGVVWGLMGAFVLVTGGLALVLGVYARRRIVSRRRLQAALAAKPPARPGGPAGCRQCGAPLDVGPGALGVRCPYCRADNLVALPRAWVAPLAGARTLGAAIEDAACQERDERTRIRASLRCNFIALAVVWLVIFGIPTAIFALIRPEDPTRSYGLDWPPSWRSFADRRLLIYVVDRTTLHHRSAQGRRLETRDLVSSDRYEALAHCSDAILDLVGVQFGASECDDEGCVRRYFVALRHGQQVRFVTRELPEGSRASFLRRAPEGSWWNDDEFGVEMAAAALEAARPAAFRADIDAWYRVDISLPGAVPDAAYRMCAEIDLAGRTRP